MRLKRIKTTICIAFAILLEINASSQSVDSIYYTLIDEEDVLTACEEVIEYDSYYYAFIQNIIDPISHFSTILIYDKELNLIQRKRIMLGDSNMIVKVLKHQNALWCFGIIRTDIGDKVFSAKLDQDFNVILQPIIYYMNDSLNYAVNDAIVNEKNQFVWLIYGKQNELLLLDSTGLTIKTLSLEAISACGTVEEFQGNYIVDLGKKFYVIDKESFSVIDSVETNIQSIYPIGNLLKLNDSVFIRSAEFSNSTPEVSERDMAILFYNKNFDVIRQVNIGQAGFMDEYGYSNLDFKSKDSIYYAYSTRLSSPSKPSAVSIACMNEKGDKHFDYKIIIPHDSNTVKRICGIVATSDGGCLVHGISIRYVYVGSGDTGQFKGFILKYNPQWKKSSIMYIQDEKDIMIYPNPAANQLNINAYESNILDVLMYDIMGKEIKRYSINANKTTLDISALHSGLYVLKIKTEEGLLTRKVQIIR
jgi:hypothetical protein